MALKSEIGTVIQVFKGARPEYQVRLKHGEIVIVAHTQIQPDRSTLLIKGSQLKVNHELGRVQSASTDLSLEQSARVVSPVRKPPGYKLELEDGSRFVVSREAVRLHPRRDLLIGAVLSVRIEAEKITQVTLVSEKQPVRVEKTDLEAGTVRVTADGESLAVRLPREILRDLHPGDNLGMEIHYSAQGERKVTLEKVSSPVKERPAAPKEPAQVSAPRPAVPPREKPAAIEAELAGIDREYLEQRRKENHRPEIMRFLNEHVRTGLIEWYRMREAKPPRFSQPKSPLFPPVDLALHGADKAFQSFYLHQARALDAIRAGRNLVIVTPTASGKTMSYNPAIFEQICQNSSARALYLFPLNALMTDQKEKIDSLREQLARQNITIEADLLVGGMQTARYEIARKNPHILATNPEMLSVILNEAPRYWSQFFANLQYVVVDEVHSYRGIFGVQMSGLLRRLLLTARSFGAEPRFILSSATVSNPLDLAARLTSLPEAQFDLISDPEDGSQQACKHWAVLNPDWGSKSGRYDNYLNVAASIFVELITAKNSEGRWAPLNTILFAKSMREVNRLYKLVQENLRQRRPELAERVYKYISAELGTQEKRNIYEGLRTGKLLGVVSTNALEAGIDIGKLDACIITGFPFSVMSMRQMAGRVGRHAEGLVLYVPHPFSFLDQYYRDHPDLLLSQPPEVFVVDPTNPYIARKHLNAAALGPKGLAQADAEQLWGKGALEILMQAVQEGVMRRVNGRFFGSRRDYNNTQDPYAIQSLRSNPQKPYALCLDDGQPCALTPECFNLSRRGCPRRIAAIDQEFIYRDCHPGAIYEAPTGKLYQITDFDEAHRSVRAVEQPETLLERTYVEEDTTVEIVGGARGERELQPGVKIAWGNVVITRSFTGYYTHTLLPVRRCRRCRKEYDEGIPACPICGHHTEMVFNYSRPTRHDFPKPYQHGFSITHRTVASWITVAAELESGLEPASPCKLPGEENRVQQWLKLPLHLDRLPHRLNLTPAEKALLEQYHQQAGEQIRGQKTAPGEALLFPGIYRQCLLHALRAQGTESRALEIFQAVTGFPVTDDLRHICRKCQTSALMPALHTLQHTVGMRYPSVALGDQSDLGSLVTLGHSGTGKPSVFWYDTYEGGLGASEKVFEKIEALLEVGAKSMLDCACSTVEGCPRCTQVPGCDQGNDGLSKAAALELINLILRSNYTLGYRPFFYRQKRAEEFHRAYEKNQFASNERGIGDESPQADRPVQDPFTLLRVQRQAHERVVQKAFEVRSTEIVDEVPPLSAVELSHALQSLQQRSFPQGWNFHKNMTPYQVIEVLPAASVKMVQQIYRVIALEVHPDANPERQAWANEMMKLLNQAYETIMVEKRRD